MIVSSEYYDEMCCYSATSQPSSCGRDSKTNDSSAKCCRQKRSTSSLSHWCNVNIDKDEGSETFLLGGENGALDSRHLRTTKPPVSEIQGSRFFERRWPGSCLRVLVLIHVFATGSFALPVAHHHPTPTAAPNTPTDTVTFGHPLLRQRQNSVSVTDINISFAPFFAAEIVKLQTTFSPQYYTRTSIATDQVFKFTVPTMAITQQPLNNPDATPRPLTIENKAPPLLSAPSDSKTFPLKLGKYRPESKVVPEGVAIKPLNANICADPIEAGAPPPMFKVRNEYPVKKPGVTNMDGLPVGTNKFWQHLTLDNGNFGVWAQPYMVWVNKDASDWGLSISHTDLNQMAYGPKADANPVQYYISPLGMRSMSLSATEFNPSTSSMTTEDLRPYSAILNLFADQKKFGATKKLSIPIVQGMGFVSGYYWNLQPVLNSNILYRSLQYVGYVGNTSQGQPRIQKWKVVLEDSKTWLIYARAYPNGAELTLQLNGRGRIQGNAPYYGLVQVSKLPGNYEYIVDSAAGAMPMSATFTSSVNGATGTYSFTFNRNNSNDANSALMYALPHHIASFDAATTRRVIPGMQLRATTKGMMTAVLTDKWVLNEANIPNGIAWLPGNVRNFGTAAKAVIRSACATEIDGDIDRLSNLNSQYFAGKALARYAQIVLVANDVLGDRALATKGLNKLIAAFRRFATNTQQQPLLYENVWRGLISSAPGDGEDFGNARYNDHHFHYGYFIYAAAMLVHVERGLNGGNSPWLTANKAYINALVRDVANPSDKDKFFPVSRSFDFFNGHSWATGLYVRGDGKDQESSSEDVMFSYGMKLWGNIIGDPNMEARGNLMLAIQKRSLNAYFLMRSDNKNHPPNFINNKVTGILFENKVDSTTYFGTERYLVQGIHMIPLIPTSPYVRDKQFCMEEWDRFFAKTVDSISNGWKGILWANAAIFAPKASWDFFAQPSFSSAWLDDGASRTWYLVFAAGLGGSPA